MPVKKVTMRSNTVSTPSILTVPESETFCERIVKEVQEAIAQRAYYLAEQRGFAPGNHMEDWFRAESELFRAVPIEFSEDEEELKVSAEVPGFGAENVDVHLEPSRLVIRGNLEQEQRRQQGQLSYSERQANQIFRALNLPVEVDPEKASAVVRDGVLEITLPKAQTAKAKRVQVQAA